MRVAKFFGTYNNKRTIAVNKVLTAQVEKKEAAARQALKEIEKLP